MPKNGHFSKKLVQKGVNLSKKWVRKGVTHVIIKMFTGVD